MTGYSYPNRVKPPAPVRPVVHRCGQCWGPFGKSALQCPNEHDMHLSSHSSPSKPLSHHLGTHTSPGVAGPAGDGKG